MAAKKPSHAPPAGPDLDEELTETQRKILTAALDVFSEKGFDGASTAEIAQRAGVAEKTIFAHYGSKQGLLVKTLTPSVFKLVEPDAFDSLAEVLRPGRSLADFLRSFIRNRIEIAKRHPKRMKLVFQEAMLRPEVRDAMRNKMGQRMAPLVFGAFADLQQRGELRTDVPVRTIFRTIASVTMGFSLARFILELDTEGELDAEIENIVALLVSALSPPAKKNDASPPDKSKAATVPLVRAKKAKPSR